MNTREATRLAIASVDLKDRPIVAKYRWHLHDGPYFRARVDPRRGGLRLRLHELILGRAPDGFEWDHADRDPQNNHRYNLRLVTHTANMRNVGRRVDNRSGYPGIDWLPGRSCWRVRIGSRHVGVFQALPAAIRARAEEEAKAWRSEVGLYLE